MVLEQKRKKILNLAIPAKIEQMSSVELDYDGKAKFYKRDKNWLKLKEELGELGELRKRVIEKIKIEKFFYKFRGIEKKNNETVAKLKKVKRDASAKKILKQAKQMFMPTLDKIKNMPRKQILAKLKEIHSLAHSPLLDWPVAGVLRYYYRKINALIGSQKYPRVIPDQWDEHVPGKKILPPRWQYLR